MTKERLVQIFSLKPEKWLLAVFPTAWVASCDDDLEISMLVLRLGAANVFKTSPPPPEGETQILAQKAADLNNGEPVYIGIAKHRGFPNPDKNGWEMLLASDEQILAGAMSLMTLGSTSRSVRVFDAPNPKDN